MVSRLDAKKFVRQYNEKNFGGNQIQVKEIRPSKNIKYYPLEQYMWKKAMPEQADRVSGFGVDEMENAAHCNASSQNLLKLLPFCHHFLPFL